MAGEGTAAHPSAAGEGQRQVCHPSAPAACGCLWLQVALILWPPVGRLDSWAGPLQLPQPAPAGIRREAQKLCAQLSLAGRVLSVLCLNLRGDIRCLFSVRCGFRHSKSQFSSWRCGVGAQTQASNSQSPWRTYFLFVLPFASGKEGTSLLLSLQMQWILLQANLNSAAWNNPYFTRRWLFPNSLKSFALCILMQHVSLLELVSHVYHNVVLHFKAVSFLSLLMAAF